MTRTIFVMIDGLRPDAISPDRTPNLERVRLGGAYTLQARSVMPSITLPCHMSIFHSVPPARHGVTDNIYTPMARPVTGLIDAANGGNCRCAMVFNWEELRDLARPGSLDYSVMMRNGHDLENGDARIADHAVPLIEGVEHEFVFAYLGTVDTAGHYYGWMSDGYLQQVQRIDGVFGRLLNALPADAAMVVQADHGGHERSHGTDMPEDMLIPWMMYGAGIKAGCEITRPVSLMDTAPTIAALLGVKAPSDWEGTPVTEAFAS